MSPTARIVNVSLLLYTAKKNTKWNNVKMRTPS